MFDRIPGSGLLFVGRRIPSCPAYNFLASISTHFMHMGQDDKWRKGLYFRIVGTL